jgi:hypothetical protein
MSKTLTGNLAMTAALNFVRQIADALFASQMERAAVRIAARQRTFTRR